MKILSPCPAFKFRHFSSDTCKGVVGSCLSVMPPAMIAASIESSESALARYTFGLRCVDSDQEKALILLHPPKKPLTRRSFIRMRRRRVRRRHLLYAVEMSFAPISR